MPKDINYLTSNFDARAWAKEYIEIVTKDPSIPTDEGTMISWFANALMCGYDEAQRRAKKEVA